MRAKSWRRTGCEWRTTHTVRSFLIEDDGVELEEDGRDGAPVAVLGHDVQLLHELFEEFVFVLRVGKLNGVETLHEGRFLVFRGDRNDFLIGLGDRYHG